MVAFLYNWSFPFLEPRKERLHSYQAHLFMQQSDNALGCLVTSRINAERCLFPKDKWIWWGTVPTTEHCMLGDWSTSPPI